MYRSKQMSRYSPSRERNYEPLMENLSYEQRANMMGPPRQRPRQFEPKFIKKAPIKHNRPKTLDRPLTPEEGLQLIDLWKRNNFLEFNNWMQVAKAQCITEFHENSSEGPLKSIKTYTCCLNLVFDFDPNHSMFANGFGKNKKLAKSMAVEKLIIDLIQNGRISAGLRENFPETLKAAETSEFKPSTTSQVKNLMDANIKKKTHTLFKKMQQALKEDKFDAACEQFRKILDLKDPEWNEVMVLQLFPYV